jgi:uncharacterized protein YbjT (DUF2867 family)
MNKTALIIGSSGLVGKKLLQLLLKDGQYQIIFSFVRKKSDLSHPRLKEIEVNFDDLSNIQLDEAIDDFYCCIGTTIKTAGAQEAFRKVDYHYVIATAEFAHERGAKKMMVISALGSNSKSRIFYNRVKGEMEDTLSEMNFDGLYIFRPSMLGGKRNEFRLGEKIGSVFLRIFGWLLIGKAKRYRIIEDSKVAASMLKASQSQRKGIVHIESEEMH